MRSCHSANLQQLYPHCFGCPWPPGLEAEAPSVGQETRSLGAQETAKAEIEVGHETEAKVEGEFELHPEAGGHGDAEMQRPEDDEDVCSEELADPKAEVTCEIPAAQNAQVPEPGFDAQEEDEKSMCPRAPPHPPTPILESGTDAALEVLY